MRYYLFPLLLMPAGTPLASTTLLTSVTTSTGSNLCVDITGGSSSIGTMLQQWACNGFAASQLFYVVPTYVNYVLYYTITDSAGHCWDLTSGSFTAGTLVEMWDCGNGNNQRFQILPTQNGWVINPATAQGMCLDISDGSASNGAAVQIFGCNGSPAQVFNFVSPPGKWSDGLTL